MTTGTLTDSSRRIARARLLEERCFEILGAWVATCTDPEVKLCFARQSHHHAWHAELFGRVLTDANGFEPASAEPDPTVAEFLDVLASASGPVDRLAGMFELWVPRTVATYERWLDGVDPVREAPLARWLTFVVSDEKADLAEGRALLAARSSGGATPGRAALDAAFAGLADLLD